MRIGILGTGVRVVRASGQSGDLAPANQPALQRQSQAADSASKAGKKGTKFAKGKSGAVRRSHQDSTHAADSTATFRGRGPLDRPGYINGKLDLDVASAAQIDSLPGVSPLMARRIVADRTARGPFLNRDGLRRVTGVGDRFLQQIDSLVCFSGVYHWPTPADTAIPRRGRRRGSGDRAAP